MRSLIDRSSCFWETMASVYRTGQDRQGTARRVPENATAALWGAAAAENFVCEKGFGQLSARRRRLRVEALDRDAAGRRDAGAIGEQAGADLLAVGNELTADAHGVAHAGLLVRLLVGPGAERRQRQAK